jgi:hypothetical protein
MHARDRRALRAFRAEFPWQITMRPENMVAAHPVIENRSITDAISAAIDQTGGELGAERGMVIGSGLQGHATPQAAPLDFVLITQTASDTWAVLVQEERRGGPSAIGVILTRHHEIDNQRSLVQGMAKWTVVMRPPPATHPTRTMATRLFTRETMLLPRPLFLVVPSVGFSAWDTMLSAQLAVLPHVFRAPEMGSLDNCLRGLISSLYIFSNSHSRWTEFFSPAGVFSYDLPYDRQNTPHLCGHLTRLLADLLRINETKAAFPKYEDNKDLRRLTRLYTNAAHSLTAHLGRAGHEAGIDPHHLLAGVARLKNGDVISCEEMSDLKASIWMMEIAAWSSATKGAEDGEGELDERDNGNSPPPTTTDSVGDAEPARRLLALAHAAANPRVQVNTERQSVVIDGTEYLVGNAQFRVIKALVEARPKRLTLKELQKTSNNDSPHKPLDALVAKGAPWNEVIDRPSNERRGHGYGIL